jgi:hypothetical protein
MSRLSRQQALTGLIFVSPWLAVLFTFDVWVG